MLITPNLFMFQRRCVLLLCVSFMVSYNSWDNFHKCTQRWDNCHKCTVHCIETTAINVHCAANHVNSSTWTHTYFCFCHQRHPDQICSLELCRSLCTPIVYVSLNFKIVETMASKEYSLAYSMVLNKQDISLSVHYDPINGYSGKFNIVLNKVWQKGTNHLYFKKPREKNS